MFSVTVPMIIGIAFGAVAARLGAGDRPLLRAPHRLVGILGSIPALEGAARWLDTSRTMAPLVEESLSATEWARLGTSLALWLLVPLALGVWRVLRGDVR